MILNSGLLFLGHPVYRHYHEICNTFAKYTAEKKQKKEMYTQYCTLADSTYASKMVFCCVARWITNTGNQ